MVCHIDQIVSSNRGRHTYNLIVRTAGVIRPRGPLHDPPRHGFEIHQIVALLQNGHALDSFPPVLFFRIYFSCLFLDSFHIHFTQMFGLVQIFVQCIWRMDGLIGLGRVLAGPFQDDLLASGMLLLEIRDIIGPTMYDDPAIRITVMFSNLGPVKLIALGILLRLVIHSCLLEIVEARDLTET